MDKKKKKALPHLETNYTGKVSVIDGIKRYAQLKEDVIKAGILDRSYGFYWTLLIISFIFAFLSAYFVIVTQNLWLVALFSVLFSFFMTQLAGIMHDAGHRAVFKSTLANDILGHILSFFLVLEFSEWKRKHNEHHAHTNQEDGDPDIELPFLSFTKERYDSKKGIEKALRKYQAYIYYPLGSLVSYSVRFSNLFRLAKNPKLIKRKKLWEEILFIIGFIAMFVLPFFIFPLPKALTFFLVSNFVGGLYLLNVFAPNHKGMPQIGKNVKLSFMEQQIMTSRNIVSNWFTDYIYLGLNNQIEHHLFPNTPRNKLPRITPYVLDICKKMKIDYTVVGVLETNKIIISSLHQFTKEN